MTTPPLRYLTVAEAASRLGIHPVTIRRAYLAHRLPVVRAGRAVRIAPDALDAWVGAGAPVRRTVIDFHRSLR